MGKRDYLEKEKSELGLGKKNWFLYNSWCATLRGSWTRVGIYSTAYDSWDGLQSPQLSPRLLSTAYTFWQSQQSQVTSLTQQITFSRDSSKAILTKIRAEGLETDKASTPSSTALTDFCGKEHAWWFMIHFHCVHHSATWTVLCLVILGTYNCN